MNSKFLTCCVVFLLYTNLFYSTSTSSPIHINSTTSILNVTNLPHSLSQSLEDFALKTLTNQHHSGSLYRAILPNNLSGIEVSIVRLTGKSLWNAGARFSNVLIPARSVSVPPVRRVAIVYQNLGNWSNHWYTVPGYRLITSVLGFRVLDVSDQDNIKEISLKMNNPVEILFRELSDEKMLSRVSCVSFKAQNKDKEAASVSRMILPGVCYGSSHGDYSVIEPLEKDKNKKKVVVLWRTWWWLWIVGLVLGFGLLWFLGFVCTMGLRILSRKKIQVMMEREANDGEVFERRWVGGSKMPSATVTRTLPESESGFENVSHG